MEKKLFTVAYCGFLVGSFSNRKLTWEAILEIFKVTDEQLKNGSRKLTGEYVSSGDWRRLSTCKLVNIKKFTSGATLSSALIKSHQIRIWDEENKKDNITVQYHILNDVELPQTDEEFDG